MYHLAEANKLFQNISEIKYKWLSYSGETKTDNCTTVLIHTYEVKLRIIILHFESFVSPCFASLFTELAIINARSSSTFKTLI